MNSGIVDSQLLWPWRVDQRQEMAFDGESGGEYPVMVNEMFPHEAHPTSNSPLDLHETVEYVNMLEARLRSLLIEWQRIILIPESERRPQHWISVNRVAAEAQALLEANAYALAHEAIREKQREQSFT
jgi:hypothetical protein